MKFDDATKTVKEILDGNQYIPFGVSKVKLNIANADKTDGGAEYIEVHVIDENGAEDSARLWFTTPGSANFSFNVLRQIIIHNTPEAKRDAMKEKIQKLPDTDAMAALLIETCVGKELWFTKYYDPTRTYEKDGQVKRSINKNVMGYEPKLKPELMPSKEGEQNAANEVPFASESDAPGSTVIPDKGSWSNQ